jgi:hypothetical protein
VSKVNYPSYYVVEYAEGNSTTSEMETELSVAVATAKKLAGKLFQVDTNLLADYETDYLRFLELKEMFEPKTTLITIT